MIQSHKIYSHFEFLKMGKHSTIYKYKDIRVILYLEPRYKVKSLSIYKNKKEFILKDMFYKDDDELIFILDRVAEVRMSFPLNTFSQSIVNAYGQSKKPF